MEGLKFGAVYIIEKDYTDEEIRRDLRNMKNDGYDLITLWPIVNPWLSDNPYEFRYDRTKFVLEECEKNGLKVIMQLFGQNQAMEGFPDALSTPEEEILWHPDFGLSINVFWCNLNHPNVRKQFDKYFESALSELKDYPAVFAWDVFNEAHFRADDEWTHKEYQKWLQKKYGDINTLNKAWYRRFASFDQIRPENRGAGYSVWSSLLPPYEYEKFRSENLTDICRFLYDTAKKYDSVHPIMIDGTSSQIIQPDILMRNNDEFGTAYIPDIYGSTFYPKSWGRNYKSTPWVLSEYFAIPAGAARKAGKPYAVNELQTHTQAALTPGSEVSPEELRNWVWINIFNCPEYFQLWRWRPFLHGYQITGRGLTQFDGTPNKRSEIIKELLSTVKANPDVFGKTKIHAPSVRIAFSYAKRIAFDTMLKYQNSFWSDDIEGWYRLFWELGANPEFTDIETLDEEDFKSDIIIVPATMMLTEKEKKALSLYVEQGGILVADSRLGTVNELFEVPKEGIPGSEMSALFAIKETDVSSGEYFSMKGERIAASYMNQELSLTDPESVKIVAYMDNGLPAVTENSYGRGKAIYFNSFVGLSLKNESRISIRDYFESLLKEKGHTVLFDKKPTTHLSMIEGKNANAMLLINFSSDFDRVSLSGLEGVPSLENIMTGDIYDINNGNAEIPLSGDACYVLKWKRG